MMIYIMCVWVCVCVCVRARVQTAQFTVCYARPINYVAKVKVARVEFHRHRHAKQMVAQLLSFSILIKNL